MSGRLYSLCLLVCVLMGLGLTALIANTQTHRDRAAATEKRVTFDAALRADLEQAHATIAQLKHALAQREERALVTSRGVDRLIALCADQAR